MPLRHRFASTLLCWCLVALPTPGISSERLTVQADLWCPFNCQPDSPQPGYVVELLMAIFVRGSHRIDYSVVPWDRAVHHAREGSVEAIIGATEADARQHGLKIGRNPIGISSDCLFVAADNPLRFRKSGDLDSLRKVGVISGYSYSGPLGEWVENPQHRVQIEVSRGERPAEVNFRNLANGRLDAVIENKSVANMLIQQLGIDKQTRLAGCVGNDRVYVAFSTAHPESTARVAQLDAGIEEMRSNGQLAKLLAKYGLKDWKQETAH